MTSGVCGSVGVSTSGAAADLCTDAADSFREGEVVVTDLFTEPISSTEVDLDRCR
jgi:hypothetical protein